ncbi:putative ADP-ribosylation factor GTPase-activating protein AGD14 [Sesamum angolense]|uniref:ADP-ribosylation factor GTPase-activating protein AGD14 n=1 Tax=Sesamum angolense TaxID=2727404 RepID=A0AAE1T5J6_9LAMI|nr:putative ADP-ribosylation factor GTPase-activating protein AGD14 [Sesamum angolense]
MGSKREEERNEKIIRGLMKLPPNRRCINCNSLTAIKPGMEAWLSMPAVIFSGEEGLNLFDIKYETHRFCLCCSREFTHRVKSVSMSKFTSQEVDALQKGGNQRARDLFLKAWDPHKLRLTDNSNADKVREFIKNVYVERRYAVEKSSDRPPKDPQALDNGGNVRIPDEVEPLSSLSSHFNMVLHDVPAGAGADCKPTNPFDLPYDADLESSYMTPFRDMSSLQAALPNNQMMAPYDYVGETNWFPQNSVPSRLLGIYGRASAEQPNTVSHLYLFLDNTSHV